MEVPYERPLSLYMRRENCEILDPKKRTIFKIEVLSGDLNYLAEFNRRADFLIRLLNGEVSVNGASDAGVLLGSPIETRKKETVVVDGMVGESKPDTYFREIADAVDGRGRKKKPDSYYQGIADAVDSGAEMKSLKRKFDLGKARIFQIWKRWSKKGKDERTDAEQVS